MPDSPQAPLGRRAAFFDVDHTILAVNSGSKWVAYMRREGKITAWQTVRSLWWLMQYRASLLDFEAMTQKIVTHYAGHPVEPIRQEVARWFHAEIAKAICCEARERIEDHRKSGDLVVILTSATRYLSSPLAAALGIEHVLCTELEEVDGVLTGRHIKPACYGPGKVHWAERFAAHQHVDLSRSYFYSDSYTDLPMLLRVGEPRVINPDPRLRRVAVSRGWTSEQWTMVES